MILMQKEVNGENLVREFSERDLTRLKKRGWKPVPAPKKKEDKK